MTNLIFLDIDGVLNNLGTVAAYGSSCENFDPVSVRLIEKLCENGTAWIVISSSWRNGDTEGLRDRLRELASEKLADRIVGETPYFQDQCRGEEIDWWIRMSSVSSELLEPDLWVIIDDDDDMLERQPFVQTTFEDGFRFRHYVKAMQFLNPDHPDARPELLSHAET